MRYLQGSHPVSVVLCKARDAETPALDANYYRDLVFADDGLNEWIRKISGGRLDLQGSEIFGWFDVSETIAELNAMSRAEFCRYASVKAAASGVDTSRFLHIIAVGTEFANQGAQGNVAIGAWPAKGQSGWRWCSKCSVLAYWDGTRSPGKCAASGSHDHSESSIYSVAHDTSSAGRQDGWRWCSKCEALVLAHDIGPRCPTGGVHDLTNSFNYVLKRNTPQNGNEQDGWRRCKKCNALGHIGGGRKCSGGDGHDYDGNGNYSISYASNVPLGYLAHEFLHALGFDHSFSTSAWGDYHNDQRPGAYGNWLDIMSWAGTAQFGTPRFTPSGAGLAGPNLDKTGWLSNSEIKTVTAVKRRTGWQIRNQTFEVGPLYDSATTLASSSTAGPSQKPRLLRIVHPEEGSVVNVEVRLPQGWDKGVNPSRVVIHESNSLYQVGQPGWMQCSVCHSMIFAGQTVCPAGGAHDGNISAEYSLNHDRAIQGGQNLWLWCKKCSGLYFSGNGTSGVCPAGGSHDGSESSDYVLKTSGSGQTQWRWCKKCQGLSYADHQPKGICPAGGFHDHGASANYTVPNVPANERQSDWRWCQKCQGLYFAGLGSCVGGVPHRLVGDLHSIPFDNKMRSGQEGWRYCSKCYCLSYSDGSRPPGTCAAGGIHDHSSSGNYVLPTDQETSVSQEGWFWCSKCSALHNVQGNSPSGECPHGGLHEKGGTLEYLIVHNTLDLRGDAMFRKCKRCQAMVYGPSPAGCFDGGDHDTQGSPPYVIRSESRVPVREQSFWRACSKCNVLFVQNSSDATDEKSCAKGGKHKPKDSVYVLSFRMPYSLWRWCQKCEQLAYFDDRVGAGKCPAGSTHDHRQSFHYMPPSFGQSAVQVTANNLQAGETWVSQTSGIKVKVTNIDQSGGKVEISCGTPLILQPPISPIR
jgi:hypothetical protein